tara:strand:+ start:1044 stop:2465 length:1422 start_codon:yes stop_codon:yes gene_type:complete
VAIFYKPSKGKNKSNLKGRVRGAGSGEKQHIVKTKQSWPSVDDINTANEAVTIDGMDWQGQGVARGETLFFVDGALPGETVEIKALSSNKQIVNAKVTKVNTPSEHRQKPFCGVANQCGGCQLQHVEPQEALALRDDALKSMFQRKLGFNEGAWQAPVSGNRPRYRRKARLAIDARNPDKIKLGFRENAGKNIVDIEGCPVLVESLSQLIAPLKSAITGYASARLVGHVSLLAGENAVQVTVKHTRSLANDFIASLSQFAVEQNVNMTIEDGNGEFTHLHEIAPITCNTVDGFYLQPGPNDFVQVNAEVNTKMVAQALSWLAPKAGERIADWFSGLGNFTLPIANSGATVSAVEGVAEMVQRAKSNALEQGITNVDWMQLDLADEKSVDKALAGGFDKVLLDPSREGALTVCHALVRATPSTIVYVSCNPNTFSRDARVLIDGGYQMQKAGVIEMFPFTHHMETMALFTRQQQ